MMSSFSSGGTPVSTRHATGEIQKGTFSRQALSPYAAAAFRNRRYPVAGAICRAAAVIVSIARASAADAGPRSTPPSGGAGSPAERVLHAAIVRCLAEIPDRGFVTDLANQILSHLKGAESILNRAGIPKALRGDILDRVAKHLGSRLPIEVSWTETPGAIVPVGYVQKTYPRVLSPEETQEVIHEHLARSGTEASLLDMAFEAHPTLARSTPEGQLVRDGDGGVWIHLHGSPYSPLNIRVRRVETPSGGVRLLLSDVMVELELFDLGRGIIPIEQAADRRLIAEAAMSQILPWKEKIAADLLHPETIQGVLVEYVDRDSSRALHRTGRYDICDLRNPDERSLLRTEADFRARLQPQPAPASAARRPRQPDLRRARRGVEARVDPSALEALRKGAGENPARTRSSYQQWMLQALVLRKQASRFWAARTWSAATLKDARRALDMFRMGLPNVLPHYSPVDVFLAESWGEVSTAPKALRQAIYDALGLVEMVRSILHPYWGVRLIEDGEGRLVKALYEDLYVLRARKEALLTIAAPLLEQFRTDHPTVWLGRFGLAFYPDPQYPSGLDAERRVSLTVDEQTAATMEILDAHPELHGIACATGPAFWREMYQIDEAMDAIVGDIATHARRFRMFHYGWDQSYELFAGLALVGHLPRDHFFFTLEDIRQGVPDYGEPSEALLWALMEKSGKVDVADLHQRLDAVTDPSFRRYLLLQAMQPLILRMDEMPITARAHFQAIVSACFFRLGSHEMQSLFGMPAAHYWEQLKSVVALGELDHGERLIAAGSPQGRIWGARLLEIAADFDFLTGELYERLHAIWRAYYAVVAPGGAAEALTTLQMKLHGVRPLDSEGWIAYLARKIGDVERLRALDFAADERRQGAAESAIEALTALREELRVRAAA